MHLKFNLYGLQLGMISRVFSFVLMFFLIPEVNASPGMPPCSREGASCCCREEPMEQSCCAPVERPATSPCRECRCAIESAPMSSGLPTEGVRLQSCQEMADSDFFFVLAMPPRADPGFEIKPVQERVVFFRHPCAFLQRWRC